MASKNVALHEAALAEAQAAYDWYATQNPGAAEAFIDEPDYAMK
jgi:plasmid stabilization system protein ParE